MDVDLEQTISNILHSLLKQRSVGEEIMDAEAGQWSELMNSLQSFLPKLLGEKYGKIDISSDGFEIVKFKRTGACEGELYGMCWEFVGDPLPFFLRLRVHPDEDDIGELEFKIGEMGDKGIVREYKDVSKMFENEVAKEITWAYSIIYKRGIGFD